MAAFAVSAAAVVTEFLLRFDRVARHFPAWALGWGRGIAELWAFLSVLLAGSYALAMLVARPRATHNPRRRGFLRAVRWAILGAPAVATAYGTFVQRFRFTVREQSIPIPGLPKDLEGLRVAQLTDIHLSPYLSARELERVVEMANETRPHVTLVTGDLITSGSDPLDDCLQALARLKADAGVYGCMGNHEIYAETEDYTQREGARLGMNFLRQQNQVLRFGESELNLAGVDYQRFKIPYLRHAEALTVPGTFQCAAVSQSGRVSRRCRQRISADHQRPYAWGTGARRDPAPGSEYRALLHTVCGRTVPKGWLLHLCFPRHRDHRFADSSGSATGSGFAEAVQYLILSDIHANREALDAVMEDASKDDGGARYDQILCLGDIVGYGADPNYVVDWIRAHAAATIRGNHDKICAGLETVEGHNPAARASAEWTRKELTPANLGYLSDLPRGPLRVADFDLVHGSPADEDEYLIHAGAVTTARDALDAQVTFFGHTHVQGGFLLARRGIWRITPDRALELEPDHQYLINPGSVGQPRDTNPRAAYAIYTPETRVIEFRRAKYDIAGAAQKILDAGLPPVLAARLYEGT